MPERALANKPRYGKQGISCQDNPVIPLHPLIQLNQLCYFLFDLQYKIDKQFIFTGMLVKPCTFATIINLYKAINHLMGV